MVFISDEENITPFSKLSPQNERILEILCKNKKQQEDENISRQEYIKDAVDRTKDFDGSISNAIMHYLDHPEDKTIAIIRSPDNKYYINSPKTGFFVFSEMTQDIKPNLVKKKNLVRNKQVLVLCADNSTVQNDRYSSLVKKIDPLSSFTFAYVGRNVDQDIDRKKLNVDLLQDYPNRFSSNYESVANILANPNSVLNNLKNMSLNGKYDIIINNGCVDDPFYKQMLTDYLPELLDDEGIYVFPSAQVNTPYLENKKVDNSLEPEFKMTIYKKDAANIEPSQFGGYNNKYQKKYIKYKHKYLQLKHYTT